MNLTDDLYFDRNSGTWKFAVADCSPLAFYVKSVMSNQWSGSTEYRVRKQCGAFLQSFSEDGDFFLVEFWTDDQSAILDFIQYIEEHFNH